MKTVWIEEPGKIAVVDTPMPEVKEGEALLQILYCGICGSDVASYTGNQPFTTYPRIPGHEFSARIAEIGENDKGLKVGDIVTANPYFNCGHCYSCERGFVNCCTDNQTMGVQRDGSFCEYIAMPIERIYPGKGLSAKELALIEPFSISAHALNRTEIPEGCNLLVMGAGPIGQFASLAAQVKGANVYVADVLDGRLDMVLKFGAKGVINTKKENLADAVERITGGNGFDVCVECAGRAETFLACIDAACFAGSVILIGNGKTETTFLHSILQKKELNVFGSRNSFKEDFEYLIDTVAAGKVDIMQMVSGIYPMDKADDAFRALTQNDGSLNKLLVKVAEDYDN